MVVLCSLTSPTRRGPADQHLVGFPLSACFVSVIYKPGTFAGSGGRIDINIPVQAEPQAGRALDDMLIYMQTDATGPLRFPCDLPIVLQKTGGLTLCDFELSLALHMGRGAQSQITIGVTDYPGVNASAHFYIKGRAGWLQEGVQLVERFLYKWLSDQQLRMAGVRRYFQGVNESSPPYKYEDVDFAAQPSYSWNFIFKDSTKFQRNLPPAPPLGPPPAHRQPVPPPPPDFPVPKSALTARAASSSVSGNRQERPRPRGSVCFDLSKNVVKEYVKASLDEAKRAAPKTVRGTARAALGLECRLVQAAGEKQDHAQDDGDDSASAASSNSSNSAWPGGGIPSDQAQGEGLYGLPLSERERERERGCCCDPGW